MSISGLDLGVADRQAFGSVMSYSRPRRLDDALDKYWNGKLHLPPHAEWEGDPTDWSANPFSDGNWQFQHHTLRWLNPLRWAARQGDEQARHEWLRIVRSWAENNVPAENSCSKYAWKDMADGNRAIQLSLGAPLVKSQDDWYVRLLEYHRDWLLDESHIVGKNHGLHQHNGLLVCGAILNDLEAVEVAIDRMRVQFETTFDEQGTNDEGSSAYHQMNITWWRQAWRRASEEGHEPPTHVLERLERAGHVLAHIALPNGELPQIGDSRRSPVQNGHSSFSDYVATAGNGGRKPHGRTLILDRGYILSRSGWGESRPLAQESHTLIRYGKELRSHSHRDRGSVHVYADGARWFVDSGFHSYGSRIPVNQYLASREAHNVADVLDASYNPNAEVELVHDKITDAFHYFELLDHGYGDYGLSRRVIYFTEIDCWIVADEAKRVGKPITQRWHLEPGVTSRIVDRGFRLASGGGKRFGVSWLGTGTDFESVQAAEGTFDAWVGEKWGTFTPSRRLTARSTAARPRIVTLFGPHGSSPLGIVDSRITSKGKVEVGLVRGASRWSISIDGADVRIHGK